MGNLYRAWNALFKVKAAVILIRRIRSDKNLPNMTLYPLKPDFSPQILSRINGKLGDTHFNSSSLLLLPRATPAFSTHSLYIYSCNPTRAIPNESSESPLLHIKELGLQHFSHKKTYTSDRNCKPLQPTYQDSSYWSLTSSYVFTSLLD